MEQEMIERKFRRNVRISRLGFAITILPFLIYIIIEDINKKYNFLTQRGDALLMGLILILTLLGFVLMVIYHRCPVCKNLINGGGWRNNIQCSNCGSKLHE